MINTIMIMNNNPCSNGKLIYGSGTPTNDVGRNGDFYVDIVNKLLYGPKTNCMWSLISIMLQGPRGSVGPQGPQGPQGDSGQTFSHSENVTVNDIFISGSLTTSDVYTTYLSVTDELIAGSIFVNSVYVDNVDVDSIVVNNLDVTNLMSIDEFTANIMTVNNTLETDLLITDNLTVAVNFNATTLNTQSANATTLITDYLDPNVLYVSGILNVNGSITTNNLYVPVQMNTPSASLNSVYNISSIVTDKINAANITVTNNLTIAELTLNNITVDEIVATNIDVNALSVMDTESINITNLSMGAFTNLVIENIYSNSLPPDPYANTGLLNVNHLLDVTSVYTNTTSAQNLYLNNALITRYYTTDPNDGYIEPVDMGSPIDDVPLIACTVNGAADTIYGIANNDSNMYIINVATNTIIPSLVTSDTVNFVDISFSSDLSIGVIANSHPSNGNTVYMYRNGLWYEIDITDGLNILKTLSCAVSPNGSFVMIMAYNSSNTTQSYIYKYDFNTSQFNLFDSMINDGISIANILLTNSSIAYVYMTPGLIKINIKYYFGFTNATTSVDMLATQDIPFDISAIVYKDITLSDNGEYLFFLIPTILFYINISSPTFVQIIDIQLPASLMYDPRSVIVNNDASLLMIAVYNIDTNYIELHMKKDFAISNPWETVYISSITTPPSLDLKLYGDTDLYRHYILSIQSSNCALLRGIYAPSYFQNIEPLINSYYRLGNIGRVFKNIYISTVSTVSDRNLKKDISDSDLGLDFINSLRPVKYKFVNSEEFNYGLIAQEVRDSLKEKGFDPEQFAGYVCESDGKDVHYMLRYNELIAPLIKANQELYETAMMIKQKFDYLTTLLEK